MGYQCPVCSIPQADATHLADHLGFTAIIHDDDEHGAWLDAHVEGWGAMSRAELREVVVEFAEDAEYPQVFEDTVHAEGEHQHDRERSGKLFEDEGHGRPQAHGRGTHDHAHDPVDAPPDPSLDAEGRAALEEAAALTERRRRNRDAEVDEGAGEEAEEPEDGGSTPGDAERQADEE